MQFKLGTGKQNSIRRAMLLRSEFMELTDAQDLFDAVQL